MSVLCSLLLLGLFWFLPIGNSSYGAWLADNGDVERLVSRKWVLVLSCFLCWRHWRTALRGRTVSGGHWLWMAGVAAGTISFLLFHRGGWNAYALAALPPTLVFAALWVFGRERGRGFVFPLLLLLLICPWIPLNDLHLRWQFKLDRLLLNQFGEQLTALRDAAWASKWYDWFPSPGNALVTGVALCGRLRPRWWIPVLIIAAAVAGAHVVFWGYPLGC